MANDEWMTPPALFNALDREFAFTVDVASTPENHLAPCFLSGPCRKDSQGIVLPLCECGLCAPWWAGASVWCNPPYSNIKPWVEKAAEAGPVNVVMLVPGLYETGWFRLAWETAWEERRLVRRVAFIDPVTGKAGQTMKVPSSLLIWRPGHRPYAAPAVSYWDWR